MKQDTLSKELQKKIFPETRGYVFDPGQSPLTAYFVKTMRHCNAGTAVEAAFWTKTHTEKGGKVFITMSGAGSSFEQGISLSKLIRAGIVAGISVTGANLEESMYRLVAMSHYKYIPGYSELTPMEENELREAGLRRITCTFLPEEESVHKILPIMETLWRKAEAEGKSYLWHEYFFQLFDTGELEFDPEANPDDCWLYQAYLNKTPLIVFGHEDSTMGNIFASYCYDGEDQFLIKNMPEKIAASVVKSQFAYMHEIAEVYLKATMGQELGLLFLQLGGGIAADGPICVIPHLKHDYLERLEPARRDQLIKALAGFIEVNPANMSLGSYSGAGWKEKITWDKLSTDSYGAIIQVDYTVILPIMTAIILGE